MSRIYAYITEYSEARGQDLHTMPADKLVPALAYSSSPNMNGMGWLKVGTATVTVHLDPRAEVVGNAVAALRQEQAKVRAEAEGKLAAAALPERMREWAQEAAARSQRPVPRWSFRPKTGARNGSWLSVFVRCAPPPQRLTQSPSS